MTIFSTTKIIAPRICNLSPPKLSNGQIHFIDDQIFISLLISFLYNFHFRTKTFFSYLFIHLFKSNLSSATFFTFFFLLFCQDLKESILKMNSKSLKKQSINQFIETICKKGFHFTTNPEHHLKVRRAYNTIWVFFPGTVRKVNK